MPYETTYSRNIPAPQVWQNIRRQDTPSITHVVPSSPREVTKIKVPEVSQSPHRVISITPPKQSNEVEQRLKPIQVNIPKPAKTSATVKPTAIKQNQLPKILPVPKELSRSSTMSIKPLKVLKPEKLNIDNRIVPRTPEQLRALQLQRESEDVRRYILTEAASRIADLDATQDPSGRNKSVTRRQINELASMYNETSLNPTYTRDEIQKIVEDKKFANKGLIDTIKGGWEALMAKLPSSEEVKGNIGDWLKEALFIASIPAIATTLQMNGKDWKENGMNAANAAVKGVWDITAPNVVQNIFDFGDIRNIRKDDLLNLRNYISGNPLNTFGDTLKETNNRVWDLFGFTYTDSPYSTQSQRLNYVRKSSLPVSDILKAIKYETERDLVSSIIRKLPRRVGEVGINVPYIEEQWQRSIMNRVSPQVKIFVDKLRDLKVDPKRIIPLSQPEPAPKPTIRSLEIPNELGVPKTDVEPIPEFDIDAKTIEMAMKNEGSRRVMGYAKKAFDEYKDAIKTLNDTKKNLERILSQYNIFKPEYEKVKRNQEGRAKDKADIELFNLALRNYENSEAALKRAKAKYQEDLKYQEEKRDKAFWAAMDANKAVIYGDDEDTTEFDNAAKKLFEAKYHGTDPLEIEKAINNHMLQKTAYEAIAKQIEEKLNTPKYLAEGTYNWPVNSLNNLTSSKFRGLANQAYDIAFEKEKASVNEVANNPELMMKYLKKLVKDADGHYSLPEWATVFSLPKSEINPAKVLTENSKEVSSGDGAVDYAKLVGLIYKSYPEDYKRIFNLNVADDPVGMKDFLHGALQMAGTYKSRVELSKTKPEIIGKPSYDPRKKEQLDEELKEVKKKIKTEEDEIEHQKKESMALVRAKEEMEKIIGDKIKNMPYNKLPDKEPNLGSSGYGLSQKQDSHEIDKKVEQEPVFEPTDWTKVVKGVVGALSTAGVIGAGEIIKTIADKTGKSQIADLAQRLDDPNHIEMNPAKESLKLDAPTIKFKDVSENALLSRYTTNQLRDAVQNYFINQSKSLGNAYDKSKSVSSETKSVKSKQKPIEEEQPQSKYSSIPVNGEDNITYPMLPEDDKTENLIEEDKKYPDEQTETTVINAPEVKFQPPNNFIDESEVNKKPSKYDDFMDTVEKQTGISLPKVVKSAPEMFNKGLNTASGIASNIAQGTKSYAQDAKIYAQGAKNYAQNAVKNTFSYFFGTDNSESNKKLKKEMSSDMEKMVKEVAETSNKVGVNPTNVSANSVKMFENTKNVPEKVKETQNKLTEMINLNKSNKDKKARMIKENILLEDIVDQNRYNDTMRKIRERDEREKARARAEEDAKRKKVNK